MKRMIWIPDDLVDGIKDAAHRSKQSVSGYLVGLHRAATEERGEWAQDKYTDGSYARSETFVPYSKDCQLNKKGWI